MRFSAWCMMLVAMMMFMTIAGVTTSFNSILDNIGFTQVDGTAGVMLVGDVSNSSLWNSLFGTTGLIVAIGAGSLISIGLFVVTKEIKILFIPIISTILYTFIGAFWATVLKISAYGQLWMIGIATILFGTLAVGFVLSGMNYIGGG